MSFHPNNNENHDFAGAAPFDPGAVPGPVRGHVGRLPHRPAAAAPSLASTRQVRAEAVFQQQQRAPGRRAGPVAAGFESLGSNYQTGKLQFKGLKVV